jgi:inhibitor of nuclear factor kappa-B kinase subunit alpha
MKFPMAVMVFCGLTWNGPTDPYFVAKGDTIDSLYYTNRILPFVKREGARLFGHRNWVYQQYGAKCHTSILSQKWCKRNLLHFLKAEHWPAQSPDLNPLDYFFWDAVVTGMA